MGHACTHLRMVPANVLLESISEKKILVFVVISEGRVVFRFRSMMVFKLGGWKKLGPVLTLNLAPKRAGPSTVALKLLMVSVVR